MKSWKTMKIIFTAGNNTNLRVNLDLTAEEVQWRERWTCEEHHSQGKQMNSQQKCEEKTKTNGVKIEKKICFTTKSKYPKNGKVFCHLSDQKKQDNRTAEAVFFFSMKQLSSRGKWLCLVCSVENRLPVSEAINVKESQQVFEMWRLRNANFRYLVGVSPQPPTLLEGFGGPSIWKILFFFVCFSFSLLLSVAFELRFQVADFMTVTFRTVPETSFAIVSASISSAGPESASTSLRALLPCLGPCKNSDQRSWQHTHMCDIKMSASIQSVSTCNQNAVRPNLDKGAYQWPFSKAH